MHHLFTVFALNAAISVPLSMRSNEGQTFHFWADGSKTFSAEWWGGEETFIMFLLSMKSPCFRQALLFHGKTDLSGHKWNGLLCFAFYRCCCV